MLNSRKNATTIRAGKKLKHRQTLAIAELRNLSISGLFNLYDRVPILNSKINGVPITVNDMQRAIIAELLVRRSHPTDYSIGGE